METHKAKEDDIQVILFSVPGAGIEPAQPCSYWCLRPARLPIPPSGHKKCSVNRECKNSYYFFKNKNLCSRKSKLTGAQVLIIQIGRAHV